MAKTVNKKWTPEEDDQLRKLIEASASIHFIASKLKRTGGAIRGRANLLKIPIKRASFGLKAKGK